MNFWVLWVPQSWALGQVWTGLQMQEYVFSSGESLKPDQKTEHHHHHPPCYCTHLATLIIVGVPSWVRLLMTAPSPPATPYIKLFGPVKASQQGGSTSLISLSCDSSVQYFQKQDLTITFWWTTKIDKLYCFGDCPGHPWPKKLKAVSHPCHWAFILQPMTSGGITFLCVGQP